MFVYVGKEYSAINSIYSKQLVLLYEVLTTAVNYGRKLFIELIPDRERSNDEASSQRGGNNEAAEADDEVEILINLFS
jgi:hypothetical protein